MGAKRVETRARKRNRQTESRKKKGVERDTEREEEGGGRERYRSRQTDKHTGERREIERGKIYSVSNTLSLESGKRPGADQLPSEALCFCS